MLTHDQMGVYLTFQHEIKLQPGTIPIVSHMRPAPLALHEKVEAAIRELDCQGIWEPVKEMEWALHLITSIKPIEEVHIMTDFTPLNKSIILNHYCCCQKTSYRRLGAVRSS